MERLRATETKALHTILRGIARFHVGRGVIIGAEAIWMITYHVQACTAAGIEQLLNEFTLVDLIGVRQAAGRR